MRALLPVLAAIATVLAIAAAPVPANAADVSGGTWGSGVGVEGIEPRVRGWGNDAPPAEQRLVPFDANVPACDAQTVLSVISAEFGSRESKFWNSGLTIVGIDHVGEVAFRPWGASYYPRRHCRAVAHVAHEGHVRRHQVNYLVREELGVLWNSTYDVEWCVVGIERHLHAAPNCEMLLP